MCEPYATRLRAARIASLPAHAGQAKPFHLAAREHLQHLLHLAVLLEQVVDVLDGGPAAGGDAAPAAAVDDVRVPALLARHAEDHRLDAVQLAVVDLDVLQLLHAGHARQHAEDARERAHLAHLLELVEEVLEGELGAAELGLHLRRLLLVERLLGLLDEAQHVAHAEDAARHAVGVEDVEVVELLAGAGELDGLAGDGADAQRGAAAGVAVELGEHDAVQVDLPLEGVGGVDRVLAGHGVDDEQHVVRLDRVADVDELGHELLVHVQAAGGVDDGDVAVLAREGDAVARDVDRVEVGAGRVARHADAPGQRLQLVDGRRTVDVGGDEHRLLAVLLEQLGELGAGGRLARALQAGHQDDGRRMAAERQLRVAAAHERDELLVHDLHDLLRRREALHDLGAERALLDVRHELAHHLEVHVGLEQRQADLAHGGVDVLGGELAVALEALHDALEALGE